MQILMPIGGKDEIIDIPEKNLNKTVYPGHKPPLENVEEKIREAVLNPVGTKRLFEIVKEQFGKPGKRGGPATGGDDRPLQKNRVDSLF
jgi:hypothetical protein